MEKETVDLLDFWGNYLTRPNADGKRSEYTAIFHDVVNALNVGVKENVRLNLGQQKVLTLALHGAVYKNERTGEWEIQLQTPAIIAAFLNSIRNEISSKIDNVIPIKRKQRRKK